jgi:UDP-2,3-diacylglucosamine pyrophosphatase LpxH
MESLNKVFTEEQVNDASSKILKASITKITDELQGKFSQEMEGWIYEHYLNSKSKIENDLIREITEEFIQKPIQYKFAKLREKLFLENKEFLTATLTDEAIMLSVENVIETYTHRNYQFEWRWKDAIIQIIGNNWHKFKDDERVNNGLLRQIENLKSRVNSLQQKLTDVENVVSE